MSYEPDLRFSFDWGELEAILRSYMSRPVDLTFGQLEALVNDLEPLVRASGSAREIEVARLESLLTEHDLETITVQSAVELIDTCAAVAHGDGTAAVNGSAGSLFERFTLTTLRSLTQPQVGRFEIRDVIAVTALALRRLDDGDVFRGLTLADVANTVTLSALRTFSIPDLRAMLEGVAAITSQYLRAAERNR